MNERKKWEHESDELRVEFVSVLESLEKIHWQSKHQHILAINIVTIKCYNIIYYYCKIFLYAFESLFNMCLFSICSRALPYAYVLFACHLLLLLLWTLFCVLWCVSVSMSVCVHVLRQLLLMSCCAELSEYIWQKPSQPSIARRSTQHGHNTPTTTTTT